MVRGQLSISFVIVMIIILTTAIVGSLVLWRTIKSTTDTQRMTSELDDALESFKNYMSKVYVLAKSPHTEEVLKVFLDHLSKHGIQFNIYDKLHSAIALDYSTIVLRPTVLPIVYRPLHATITKEGVYKILQGKEIVPIELKGTYTVMTKLRVHGGGYVKAGFGTQDVLVLIKEGEVCAFTIGYYKCKPFHAEEYSISISKSKNNIKVQVYNELGQGVSFDINKEIVQDPYLVLYVTFNNVETSSGYVTKVYDESEYLWNSEVRGVVQLVKGLKDNAVLIDDTNWIRFNMYSTCPPGWVEGRETIYGREVSTGHCYKYISTPMTWTEAKAYCEQLGGYLFVPSSDSEIQFVLSLTGGRSIWVGFYQDPDSLADNFGMPEGCPGNEPKDCWKSVNYENEVPYFKWDSGQPDNWRNIEHCAELRPSGVLNDIDCKARLPFVCEMAKPFPRYPKDSLTYVVLIKPIKPGNCGSWTQYVVGVSGTPECNGGIYLGTTSNPHHVFMEGRWDSSRCCCDGPRTYVDPYDGNWHVIIGVWQSKNQRVYIDGKYDEIKRYEYHPTWDSYFYIGAIPHTANTCSPTFILDEVLFYHRALSDIEVQWLTDVLLGKKFIGVYQEGAEVLFSEIYIEAENVEGMVDVLNSRDLEELNRILMSSKYIIFICDQYTSLPEIIKRYAVRVTYVGSANLFGRTLRDFYACTNGKDYIFVKNIYSSKVLFIPAKALEYPDIIARALKMLYS